MTSVGRSPGMYDTFGIGYEHYRRREPRIADLIDVALSDAVTVLDVGSGTGSYQPQERTVIAVEPSRTMIEQRPPTAAPVVQAVAEQLPFGDATFDASLAVLTIHHWLDPAAGLRELARVAPCQVVLTFDPQVTNQFWLVRDYLPELAAGGARLAGVREVTEVLALMQITIVPVPWDCADGLMGAYWRRPAMYLDPGARQAISGFHRLHPGTVDEAMMGLESDLSSGRWVRRHRQLLDLEEIDFGLRLVVCAGLHGATVMPS